jgi:NACHT domain
MVNELTSSHKAFLLTLVLCIVALIVAWTISAPLSLFIAVMLCVFLWVLRPLLMPPGAGATRVRVISVVGILAIAAGHNMWAPLIDAGGKVLASNPRLLAVFPGLSKFEFSSEPSFAMLAFVIAGVGLVNYFMIDRTIASGHPVPLKVDFPEQTFRQKLKAFCSALAQHLETTDRTENWSPEYYADLEAEVEIVPLAGSMGKKRIMDLQKAMRKDHETQAFLVLGDPGAGKSVALRKLARDMLAEVGQTGRVPIYINLREWLPRDGRRNAPWSEQNVPTIQELEAFIIANIKARGDVFTEKFVNDHFRQLWEHGRLFFIFDSFDEIPELLDVNEDPWLINALSDLLSRFIATAPHSRGVLASRVFRRPTHAYLAQRVLEIRPLSEERITQALQRFPTFTVALQKELFRERHDLVPIARNPFLAALLGEWVHQNRTLPQNQAQLYESYLAGRLAECAAKLKHYDLSAGDVLCGATDIGQFVFGSPEYGLEAPVSVIADAGITDHAAAVIDVLSYARIGRVTPGDSKSFAFVHRRFLEYFVTMRLLTQPDALPVEHIPTDSRGRDVMVLYAQLCEPAAAEKLAVLCWEEIQKHFDDPLTRLRGIHSLRFLIDAYRSRRSALACFAAAFADFIHQKVEKGENLLDAKICLEGTGLLEECAAVPVLMLALEGKNSWLQETAFRACRSLPALSKGIERAIINYIIKMPILQFHERRRSIIFSLMLSDVLASARRVAKIRSYNFILSIIGFFVSLCFNYVFIMILTGLVASLKFIAFFDLRVFGKKQHATRKENFKLPFDFFRGMFCLLLIFVSALGVILEGISFYRKFNEGIFLASNDSLFFQYLFSMLLGMLMADWLIAWLIFDYIIKKFRENSLLAIRFILLIPFAIAGIITFAYYAAEFVEQYNILKEIFFWGGSGFVAVFFIISISSRCILVVDYFLDRRYFKTIAFSEKITRMEIASIYSIFKLQYWRMKFIHKLAQSKTMATGNWPDDFKLAVTDDPVLTELAKLEERWLKLDR